MQRAAAPTRKVWLRGFEIGLAYEAQITLGGAFEAPSARRDYLTRLAQARADRTGKPGTPGDELLKDARKLIHHLNALQRKANARAERESLAHPALRLTRSRPVEDEGLLPVEAALVETAGRIDVRRREAEKARSRERRAREKERQAQAVAA